MQKRTKIVATIGPATESKEQLKKLLLAGMNIIRMNFSHGDFAEHQKKIDNGKKASKETGIPVAFLQDLAGPEIRTGAFTTPTITLKRGDVVTVVTGKRIIGDQNTIYMDYDRMVHEVPVGNMILIDDGKVRIEVVKVNKSKGTLECKVRDGGIVKDKRGVNIPGVALSLKSLTEKDKADLKFGIKNKVDFVAFSFVRTPEDVKELRIILDKAGLKETGIIPKIETATAVENIEEIIKLSDAVMIARGDLAPEMSLQDVPIVQKRIVDLCRLAGKPVIVATQMIESMMHNPTPSRADVSDIANAIFDGTDAIMLSGETTLGDYPIEAVQTMTTISQKIENDALYGEHVKRDVFTPGSVGAMMTRSAVFTAGNVNAKYIICLTEYGYTARMVSRQRPSQEILAFTPNSKTFSKLLLNFGITPVMMKNHKTFDETMREVRNYLKKNKLVKKGDKIVVASGSPFKRTAETNVVVVEEF